MTRKETTPDPVEIELDILDSLEGEELEVAVDTALALETLDKQVQEDLVDLEEIEPVGADEWATDDPYARFPRMRYRPLHDDLMGIFGTGLDFGDYDSVDGD